jgi:hypothetical protein
MFRDKKTEEATLDRATIAELGGMDDISENLRAFIERSKRSEEYGLFWIKSVGLMFLIFVLCLWCYAFGVFK